MELRPQNCLKAYLAIFSALGAFWTVQGQRVEIQMKAGGPSGHQFVPGGSKVPVTKEVLEQAKREGKGAPVVAFRDGDTIVLRNAGTVFYKPFSLTAGNRFTADKAGIKPGDSMTVLLHNKTDKPIYFSVFDEIHNNMKLNAVILPEKEAAKGAEWSYSGEWDSTFGKLTMTQTGNSVKGRYEGYSPGTIDGEIDADGWLQFTWKQETHHGVGKFKMDGPDHFMGDWNYILSDGKSKGNGGSWTGKRKKAQL